MRATLTYRQIALEPFESLPASLWSEDFFSTGELVNRLVDAAALDVLERVGVTRRVVDGILSQENALVRGTTLDGKAHSCACAPDRLRCCQWLFEWLGDAARPVGITASDVDDLESIVEIPDLASIADRAVGEIPGLAPSVELITLAAAHYPEFLRGETDGDRILFTAATLSLWERYFSNDHAVVRGVNLLGAHAVEEEFGERETLRILEVGGGLGSAAECLLESLGPRIARYLFTDAHPGFLRRGSDRLARRFPDLPLESALLDLNRDLEGQGLSPGSFDLVYGVNVFHLARDLPEALERVRALLAGGGLLIFVEGTRPAPGRPIAAEFIFQLLPEFRDVRFGSERHPESGFLTGDQWLEALEAAGFSRTRTVPDLPRAVAAYPNLAMAAFIAGGAPASA